MLASCAFRLAQLPSLASTPRFFRFLGLVRLHAVFTSRSSSGGRKRRVDAERLEPELTAPPFRVIEVLVLLILDLFVGSTQRSPVSSSYASAQAPISSQSAWSLVSARTTHSQATSSAAAGFPAANAIFIAWTSDFPDVLYNLTSRSPLAWVES